MRLFEREPMHNTCVPDRDPPPPFLQEASRYEVARIRLFARPNGFTSAPRQRGSGVGRSAGFGEVNRPFNYFFFIPHETSSARIRMS